MDKNLYDLVQECFEYNEGKIVTFKLSNFVLLFEKYEHSKIFNCLTIQQKEYLRNNFPNFQNLHNNGFIPLKYFIDLSILNNKILREFKSVKMRPATKEEQKSVSDGIKSISKPVVNNKEEKNTMEKSKIVFTDENISRLNQAYLNSDNSEMPFLQELSKIINKCESSSDAERKAIRDLIELNAVVYSDVMFPSFSSDTNYKLKEIYDQMREEFFKHLNLDYLVDFEEKFKEKLQKEFNEFIKSVQEEQKTNPNYAIQHAYEICWKEEIVFVADDINYDDFGIIAKKNLLNTNGILDVVYQEWLDKDSSDINDQLYDIITEI